MEEQYRDANIIFFDGVCNFCNATIDRISRYNRKKDLYFASLQSDFAKRNLPQADVHYLDTIVFYSQGKLFYRSDAILEIAKHLSGIHRLLYATVIVPRFIRNGLYNVMARNRYRFFGKRSTCRIPTAEEKKYFIDN